MYTYNTTRVYGVVRVYAVLESSFDDANFVFGFSVPSPASFARSLSRYISFKQKCCGKKKQKKKKKKKEARKKEKESEKNRRPSEFNLLTKLRD